MALPIAIPLIEMGMGLISKLFPDPAQKAEANMKLLAMHQAGDLKELDAAMQTIMAEAKSEHFIVAAWRPITMLTFVFIIANNYVIYPYLSLFWPEAPMLIIPPDMWDLLKLGLGGYVVGRSVEKGIKNWKQSE